MVSSPSHLICVSSIDSRLLDWDSNPLLFIILSLYCAYPSRRRYCESRVIKEVVINYYNKACKAIDHEINDEVPNLFS